MTTVNALPDLPALSAAQLHHTCDPHQFDFQTTAELEDLAELIGQLRAMEAVQFGTGMRHDGYNLFVQGPPGLGKRSMVRQWLAHKAPTEPDPPEWCYLHNFKQPHKPQALSLPPGRGAELRDQMAKLVDYLRSAIPGLFESDEYRAKAEAIQHAFSQREEAALKALGDEAESQQIFLLRTPSGFTFVPTRDGEVVPPDEFSKLPDTEKQRIANAISGLQDKLGKILEMLPRWRKERAELQEAIQRNIILIDTEGAVQGQINGLSVLDMGDFAFGQPSRITAITRMGEGEVLNIEREVKLSGALHSKGVLILSSFLAGRYARNQPLSLAASLVFEQSYGHVDGDSASLAETCALLSDLAGAPIRQSLAVTGSINQLGHVQAIGGVNEKIEGFFDTCAARGLTGEQGVLIPSSNVQHLMLRHDVVAAVSAGRFRVWAVDSVDQAISLLTGLPAGEPDAQGEYPEGSLNQRVMARLKELTELWEEKEEADSNEAGDGPHHKSKPKSAAPEEGPP